MRQFPILRPGDVPLLARWRSSTGRARDSKDMATRGQLARHIKRRALGYAAEQTHRLLCRPPPAAICAARHRPAAHPKRRSGAAPKAIPSTGTCNYCINRRAALDIVAGARCRQPSRELLNRTGPSEAAAYAPGPLFNGKMTRPRLEGAMSAPAGGAVSARPLPGNPTAYTVLQTSKPGDATAEPCD